MYAFFLLLAVQAWIIYASAVSMNWSILPKGVLQNTEQLGELDVITVQDWHSC